MSTKKTPQPPRLRSACDACHQAKVRCTGGSTCLHCRNHDLQCHYSYAARIGKPKGSRNRKTLARLQCAGRQENRTVMSVDSGQSSSGLPAVPVDSALWNPSLVAPAWTGSENLPVQSYPLPSQQSQDSYSWLWQPLPPSPPESVNACFNTHIPGEAVGESQGLISANTGTVDAYTPGHMPWVPTSLPPDDNLAEDSSSNSRCDCDCLERQTSQVIHLHHHMRRDGEQDQDPFDSGLQGLITSCLQVCQKTLRCPFCEKDASTVFLIVASVQIALRRLEESLVGLLLMAEKPPSSSSPEGTTPDGTPLRTDRSNTYYYIKQTLLRQALSQAQDTLRDLQSVITPSSLDNNNNNNNNNKPASPSAIIIIDSSYLRLVIERLQTGVDVLHGAVDGWVVQLN